jgi:hypothetical protein
MISKRSLRCARLVAAVIVTLSGTMASSQLAAAATTATRTAPAATGWTIRPVSAHSVPTAEMKAVSCPAASWCMSAGTFTDTRGVQSPLAERWNGTAWTTVPAVSAGGALGSALQGVSCTSPQACLAVGYSVHYGSKAAPLSFTERMFAERWNGTSWRAITPPSSLFAAGLAPVLTSVSCASATACTAVAEDGLQEGSQFPGPPPLLLTWNGTRWSRAKAPAPRNAGVALSSVSCTRGGACFAAGSYTEKGRPSLPFAVSRPRATAAWHYRTPPAPFPTTAAAIKASKDANLAASSISCPTATSCTIVGSWQTSAATFPLYSEVWNGSRWKLIAITRPAGSGTAVPMLDTVSCSSATSCLALGRLSAPMPGTVTVLAERRSGSHWTAVNPPPAPAGDDDEPADRSLWCRSATSCLVVGSLGKDGPRASLLRGTAWTALTVPSPAGLIEDSLADVSCSSASTCAAVGYYISAAGEQVLIESGGRGTWSPDPAPSPAGQKVSQLTSVACPTATFCLSVGYTEATIDTVLAEPLSEVRHGTAWQIAPSPATGTNYGGTLSDISCASPSFCVAVGLAETNSGTAKLPQTVSRQLIEQWDGTSWTVVPGSVPAGVAASSLNYASCPSATFCLAIGTTRAASGASQLLVESFNGTAWSHQSQAGLSFYTKGISCTSASFCMAVGATPVGDKPVTQSWNGSAWHTLSTPSPSPNQDASELTEVSCTSPSACTAAGGNFFAKNEAEGPESDDYPFAEAWNGTAWSAASLPMPGDSTQGVILSGVSCTAPGQCVTAGTNTTADTAVRVIESRG